MEKFTLQKTTEMMTPLYQNEKHIVVHLHLDAGKKVPEHDTPATAFIIPIKGRVLFSSPDMTYEIAPGDVLHLPPTEPHSLKAVEESDLIVIKCDA